MRRYRPLARKTPLKPGKPLAPSSKPMKRGVWATPQAEKRRREREKVRREAQFSEANGYRKHVIETPCAACGSYDPEVGSQPAHVGKTRGAGAKADHVLSLCWQCHDYEGAHRNEFNAAFKARHGVLPVEMARFRFEQYHRERATDTAPRPGPYPQHGAGPQDPD